MKRFAPQSHFNRSNGTTRHFLLTAALLASSLPACHATEWFVSASASPGGTGTSSSSPFQTIGAAVAKAQTSDTITVADGTYPESVLLTKGGTASAPFTFRAANGARPLVTGFRSIPAASWTLYSGAGSSSVYKNTVGTSAVPWKVRDLYVSASPVPLAKTVRQTISTVSSNGNASYTLTVPSVHANFDRPRSSFVYIDEGADELILAFPITQIADDGTTTTVTYSASSDPTHAANVKAGSDTVALCNHPSLIGQGTWCYEDLGNGSTDLYYGPGQQGNLNLTQSRNQVRGIQINGSYVNATGFDVSGNLGQGLNVTGSNVSVQSFTVYANGGGGGNSNYGVNFDSGSNNSLQNSLVTGCYTGMDIVAQQNFLLSQTLICYNYTDGLNVADRVNVPTDKVTIQRCYIHHDYGLLHPDNLQTINSAYPDGTTRTITNLTLDSTALAYGGQNIIAGNVSGTINNCAFLSATGSAIQGTADWTLTNNTFANSDAGAFHGNSSSSLVNTILSRSILTYVQEASSDYNLFWDNNSSLASAVAITTPPYKPYTTNTLASLYANTGYEQHSTGADPLFTNEPIGAGFVSDDLLPLNQLYVSAIAGTYITGYFNVGDVIEIGGDGVARTITASTPVTGNYGTTITFTPSKVHNVWRSAIVTDWPANTTNVAIDIRPRSGSPALSGGNTGGRRGSNISLPDYTQGKFDGTGNVNIPAIPTTVKNSWSDTTNHPYWGIN